jgi:general secretion pathway protein N
MKRYFGIGLIVLASATCRADAATTAISGDALDAGILDDARLAKPVASDPAEPVTTVRLVPPPVAPARTLSPNPIWGVPLNQLSDTRDRPVFSPSRRPPPPAVVAEPVVVKPPPPRKKEIEPPRLSLVGTIASEDEGFGIFLDSSTKAALQLRVGDDYQGWKLRTIRGGEATMEKDERAVVLSLPPPGGEGGGEVRLIPVNAIKAPVATRR